MSTETDKTPVNEAIAGLFNGIELTEEFKTNAAKIFAEAVEAAATAKAATQIEEAKKTAKEEGKAEGKEEGKKEGKEEAEKEMKESYETKLKEGIESVKAELSEDLDAFTKMVAEQWLQENTVAVETGARVEFAENFINRIMNVFAESYVEVPKERFDVFSEMEAKLKAVQDQLDEQLQKNMTLNTQLKEEKRAAILSEVSKGLVDTVAEKLAGIAKGIDYEDDVSYREKLSQLKETLSVSDSGKGASDLREKLEYVEDKDELLDEGANDKTIIKDAGIGLVVETLNRMGKSR